MSYLSYNEILTLYALAVLAFPATIDSMKNPSMLSNWPIPNAVLMHSVVLPPMPFLFRWMNRNQVPLENMNKEHNDNNNNHSGNTNVKLKNSIIIIIIIQFCETLHFIYRI